MGCGVGAVFLVLGLLLRDVPGLGWVFVAVGAVVLALGLATTLHAVRLGPDPVVRDEEWQRLTVADVAAVPPPSTRPWTLDQVVAGLVHAFADTPYAVLRAPAHAGDRLVVRADVVDARWWSLLQRHRLASAYTMLLVPRRPGVLERQDRMSRVEWAAGLDGQLVPHASFAASGTVGRVWRVETRKEVVLTPGLGVETPVDYTFSTGEVQRPVKEVVERAGWRLGLDPATRVGLGFAIVGGGGAVVSGLVLAVLGVTGRL